MQDLRIHRSARAVLASRSVRCERCRRVYRGQWWLTREPKRLGHCPRCYDLLVLLSGVLARVAAPRSSERIIRLDEVSVPGRVIILPDSSPVVAPRRSR